MPLGSWVDARSLAKNSEMSVHILVKFLTQARKKGIVERKMLPNGYNRIHLWRRIA